MDTRLEVAVIDIKQVTFGERFRVDYGDLDLLVESIKKEGIIQPLAVKRTGPNQYTLLAGGRRYKACTLANISQIPVRIYPESISEMEMRAIELMENVARKDLDWVEALKLKQEINNLYIAMYGEKKSTAPDAPGWSKRDTAALLQESHTNVQKDINLAEALELFPVLKQAKNKHDAEKMLQRMKEDVVAEEIAKRLAAKTASTPIERIHADMCNRYIVRDFFEGIRDVPDRSVDIVEIDPPYAINLTSIKKHKSTDIALTEQYNEVPEEEYAAFMAKVFTECYRVMSENSWLICWFAIEPWIETLYQIIRTAGFETRRLPGMWYKGGGQLQTMQPALYLANSYEPFFYCTKGRPSITKQGRSNVFHYKPVISQRKTHPTERPVELIQEVLSTFGWEGARVLVPFLGSGNTILAASNVGMQAFGFDLAQEYKSSFVIKVHDSRPGLYTSLTAGQREEEDDGVPF